MTSHIYSILKKCSLFNIRMTESNRRDLEKSSIQNSLELNRLMETKSVERKSD